MLTWLIIAYYGANVAGMLARRLHIKVKPLAEKGDGRRPLRDGAPADSTLYARRPDQAGSEA